METKLDIIKELEPIKRVLSKAEVAANDLQIKVKEDLTTATELLSNIKKVGKAVEEKEQSITKPLNEALRNARALFSPPKSIWSEAERIVKSKMVKFQNDEMAKAAKKTEVIERKVEEGKMSFEKAADKIEDMTPQKTVSTEYGSAQFKTIKKVVIEDETKIPREFLVPDMVKIRKVALAGVEIAGIKVIDEQIVAGR